MAAYPRPEPRFRRAYAQPAPRRWFARRVAALAHLGLALAAAGGAVWGFGELRRADLLRIDTITVEGNRRLSSGEVAGLVEVLRGQNLLAADLEAGRASLSSSGWVREAMLRRVLPAAVHVTLDERRPVGLSRFGFRLYLVDAAGRVIDEFGPRFADLDLPIIDGLPAPGEAGAPAADPRHAALAARLLAEIGADRGLAARVSQVDVTDPHDAVVLLNGDPVRIHLGGARFAARLRTYLDVAPALREAVPDIDYVDLRFDRRVYVGPADGPAAARRAALRARLAETRETPRGRGPARPREIARVGLAAERGQRRQRGT